MLFTIISAILLLGTLIIAVTHTTAPIEAQPDLRQGPLPTIAPVATCETRLQDLLTAATDVCIDGPVGFFCNGGAPTTAEPAGPAANSLAPLGSNVGVDVLDAVRAPAFTEDGASGGIVYMRVGETGMNGLLLGDVTVRNQIEPGAGFPRWTAFLVFTPDTPRACFAEPHNAFLAQNSDLNIPIRIVVNGVSLDINGTVMIYTEGTQTVFVVVEGITRVLAAGEPQVLVAGQETRVAYAQGDWTFPISTPTVPAPYIANVVEGLPVELFDRATILPQPGFVSTDGPVNMRTAPGTDAPLIYQVPAGQTMTILGRNPGGEWYHIRLGNGQTGWMFAELLRRNHGEITAIYDSTPVPPQRYGSAGVVAYVNSPNGLTMRSAPHVGFPAIYNLAGGTELSLLERSPYSPWVKVETDGAIGWVPLLNLNTNVIVESLPIDLSVPLPPEPTAVPGISGFAFPDPACFPDC